MKKMDKEYLLNLTIPKGETGDRGLKGAIGPTGLTGNRGPVNFLESMAFVEYKSTDTNGTLEIVNVDFLPQTNNIFQRQDNFISFSRTGYYEFYISGLLEEEIKSNRAVLYLRTQHQANFNNYMTIRLSNDEEKIYFTAKRIKRFSYPQDVSLLLNKSSDSNARAENVIMIIKKLPFS